ncbi:GGDEF domain-containing protein [Alkalimonas sp. MEB108]|uniref:diguanylate cyclase n=1 Tax=Alkalimonas cellulosilytica TaxID=3058395 RepID=A0ABU7J9Z6_9GAMM|nr:GGDEF domain-containing protein [Alkalimonas sp. MEB108]MEE2003374.1 GGDEF domain-containing protein [Alkalimonas sp. MEB108]
MLSGRWHILFFCFVMLGYSTYLPASPLSKLEPEFNALYIESQQQPATALQQIEIQLGSAAGPLQQAQLLYIQAELQTLLVYPEQALKSAAQALALIDASEQPWLYHSLQLVRAYAFDLAGTPAEGMTITENVLQFAKELQHQQLFIQALVVRGVLQLSLVNYVEALQDLLHAYQLAPTTGAGVVTKGHIAGYIALVYEYRREHELSIPYFEEAVAFHQQQNSPVEVSIAMYGLGKAHSKLGDLAIGKSKLQQSLQLAEAAGDDQGVAYAQKELAGIALQQQDPEQAKTLLLLALASFEQANNRYMLLDTQLQLGRIALQAGDTTTAEVHLQQAKHFADPEHMPIQHAEVQRLQAEWLSQTGQSNDAYQLLKTASLRLTELQREESTQLLHQLRAQHELDSRMLENELLQKELELQHSLVSNQARHQRLLTALLIGAITGSLLLLLLLTRIWWQRKRLHQLAHFDNLTSLPNRHFTLKLLDQQLRLASRHNHPLSVAMLDLDHFKQVNDQFGHATGDQLLRDFATLCQQQLRSSDIIGRIGGEEFLAILPHTPADAAAAVLEKLRQGTEQLASKYDADRVTTTVSIGMCAFSGYDSADTLMLSADQALYEAKAKGRNQLQLSSAS